MYFCYFCVNIAVGIDLGTTFSVVGFSKDGKVVIVQDKAGHKIFPSIVSYLNNGGDPILSLLVAFHDCREL